MTTIHAYRRTLPHTVELLGHKLEFKVNAAGDQVCDVADDAAAARLLEISEGYRLHGGQGDGDADDKLRLRAMKSNMLVGQWLDIQKAAAGIAGSQQAHLPAHTSRVAGNEKREEDPDDAAAAKRARYTITDGETTVNLLDLDRDALRAFAKQHDVDVHPSAKAETLRERIVAALTGA